MPDTQLLMAFIASATVFAYAPGPSTLYAAAQTIAGGRKQGLRAALGIHLGGYFHVAIVALGIASLFNAVPMAYTAMKVIGSIYLCLLGINMWRAATVNPINTPSSPNATETVEREIESSNTNGDAQTPDDKTLLQSALVEVLNPKTAIFYLAFLPQFTDPNAGLSVSSQLLILGTTVNILFSSADLLCVFFADRIVTMSTAAPRSKELSGRLAGTLLVLLGINLLI